MSTLTIEKGDFGVGRSLRNLWLRSYRDEALSAEYMDGLCAAECERSGVGTAAFKALNVARCSVRAEGAETISVIVARGGLLHCGPELFE